MRKLRNQQLPLIQATADHPKAKEYARISEILDSNHSIYELTLQDFDPGDKNVGAHGMTAEQIIRAAIVKQIEGYSYRELAFHLYDSLVFRQFCKIGYKKPFKKSTLQQSIKSISAETWEAVNRVLVCYAGVTGGQHRPQLERIILPPLSAIFTATDHIHPGFTSQQIFHPCLFFCLFL